jgi:hypothetical protein
VSAAPRAAGATGRLVVAGFCWLTAAYGFVASSAFAYQQFIRPRVFAWVGWFSDSHAVIGWVWLAVLAAVLRPFLRSRRAERWLAAALLAVAAAATVWNAAFPVLPGLRDGSASLVAGILALVPIAWLGALDVAAAWPWLGPARSPAAAAVPDRPEARLFTAAMGAVLFVSVLYGLIASMGAAGQFEPDLMAAGLAAGLIWSTLHHLIVASAAFLVLALVLRLTPTTFLIQYAAVSAVLLVALVLVWEGFVAGAIGLSGVSRHASALAVAATIVAAWGGSRLRSASRNGERWDSALDAYFGPAPRAEPKAVTLRRLATVAVAAGTLVMVSRQMDWDFLLLKCGVIGIWLAALSAIHRTVPARVRVRTATIVLVSVGSLGATIAARAVEGPRYALDRYRVYNPSFRVADELLIARSGTSNFDRFLRAHTGFTDVAVRPVDLDLAVPLPPVAPDRRPLVFLFVIDSLRTDYLSPYNSAVHFTPRLAEFAADSLVFTNAFTRYGGTGLSMPAMWAGSAIVHKQYVEPFHPMNALDKLLRVNGYAKALSLDHITVQLLGPGAAAVELDEGVPEMQFDFCRTLQELERRLDEPPLSEQPVFAHTRSLNLHVAAVRYGAVPPGESYPGFHPPYASRVFRMDACFGHFIDALKRRRLWDRSLVVLTSDHGELLGEDGQWGHSYQMVPEVVQVPLIVRFPAGRRPGQVDVDAVALTTDIVPTIYAALGYEPGRPDRLTGRSLVDPAGAARARVEGHVLAASYGAVYAVVGRNGREIYVVDAINGGDRIFERSDGTGWTEGVVSDATRTAGQYRIRRQLDEIAGKYGLVDHVRRVRE